jgi:hypothetical protein
LSRATANTITPLPVVSAAGRRCDRGRGPLDYFGVNPNVTDAACPNRVHNTVVASPRGVTGARFTTKARFTTVEPSLDQLEEPT